MSKVANMIRELVLMVEKETGHPLPEGATNRIAAALSQRYGGEEMYVPKLPKLIHTVRLASMGTSSVFEHGTGLAALGTYLGRSPRTVRRILRGK
jgi:hypothetical protein